MEPSAFSWRILAAYAPLRATMQRKRACGDLSVLYDTNYESLFLILFLLLYLTEHQYLLSKEIHYDKNAHTKQHSDIVNKCL